VPGEREAICPLGPQLRGQYVPGVLQSEAQNKETGVRTTQDRMEKVRRELHLPVR